MTTFCFVGDCRWVGHLDVVEDNREVAFLVFLYIEMGIFFHISSYIFTIECRIPVIRFRLGFTHNLFTWY